MSWMHLSDYLVIEEAAAARIDDLRDEAALSPLGTLFRSDVRRRIDDVIDYFGEARRENHHESRPACPSWIPARR